MVTDTAAARQVARVRERPPIVACSRSLLNGARVADGRENREDEWTLRRWIWLRELHAKPGMASLAIAGAGTSAISWILGVAGASRTVLDVQVPYAPSAVVEYAGSEPEQFVSVDAARALARAAYCRAASDCATAPFPSRASPVPPPSPPTGRSAATTADTLRFTGTRGAAVRSLTLVKGLRDRAGEDAMFSALILNALAEWSGVSDRLSPEVRG